MRCFILLTFVFACFMAMAWSAAIEEVAVQEQTGSEGEKATPTDLSDVDTGVNNEEDSTREARQFLAVGFGRPYYGGYGGYGGFGRPYGGYYGRPYGGYYGRPYGGYYGRPYGYGGFYG